MSILDQVPNLKVEEDKIQEGPEGETSLQLLQAIYRNKKQPLNVRVRCAIEALAHEYPKVSAVQVSHMNGQDFATALERAIERSRGPTLLNGPVIEHDASEVKKPFSVYRRFAR